MRIIVGLFLAHYGVAYVSDETGQDEVYVQRYPELGSTHDDQDPRGPLPDGGGPSGWPTDTPVAVTSRVMRSSLESRDAARSPAW